MLLSKLEAKKMGFVVKEKKQELTPEQVEAMKQYCELSQSILDQSEMLLQKHLHLIKENELRILKTPKYFFAEPPAAGLSLAMAYYSSFYVNLPVGVLIKLWNDGTLIMPCEKCNKGKVHIFHWWGNTIRPQYEGGGSGFYVYKGICDSCGEIVRVHKEGRDKHRLEESLEPIHIFQERLEHARRISASNENEEIAKIIDPGVPQHFSWSKGVVPEIPATKQVITPQVIPVSFAELIQILLKLKVTSESPSLTFM
jgi:hypothetical protein